MRTLPVDGHSIVGQKRSGVGGTIAFLEGVVEGSCAGCQAAPLGSFVLSVEPPILGWRFGTQHNVRLDVGVDPLSFA